MKRLKYKVNNNKEMFEVMAKEFIAVYPTTLSLKTHSEVFRQVYLSICEIIRYLNKNYGFFVFDELENYTKVILNFCENENEVDEIISKIPKDIYSYKVVYTNTVLCIETENMRYTFHNLSL